MKLKKIFLIGLPVLLFACNNASTEINQNESIDTSHITTETDTASIIPLNLPTEKAVTYGIDISKYQGNELEVLNRFTDSLTFVICKGTEGNTYTDPSFAENWKEIHEKNYIGGIYHFYHSNDAPESQSQNFLSVLNDLDKSDFAPIVDVESGGIEEETDIQTVQDDLISFLNKIEEATGRTPIIYTNVSVGDKYFDSDKFNKYPLWIADYSGADEPRMPGVWADTKWTLWQKTDRYLIDNKKNDFDVFNGSLAHLKAFIATY